MQTLARGLGFTEGPLWIDGEVWLTGSSRGLLYAVDVATGEVRVVAETGGTPTGLARQGDGTIWIAQGSREIRASRPTRPGIQRLSPNGEVSDLDLGSLFSPNDCVIGPDQRLWFTDPTGSALDGDTPSARVYTLDPATGMLQVFADGIKFPNGLAFSPSGDALYVAESRLNRVLRFDLGTASPVAELFAAVQRGHPDGLAIDSEGRVHVAAFGSNRIEVFESSGKPADGIVFEDDVSPTNLCFGGSNLSTLFVTVPKGGRLLAVSRDVPGLPADRA